MLTQITINMYDFVLSNDDIKKAEDAKIIYNLMQNIIDTIINRDTDNPKFGKEQRQCLLNDYSILFKHSYPDLYKEFCEDYLYSILYPYLLKKLKSIHNRLGNAKNQLNGSYNFSQQKNDITVYMNDIYGIYCEFKGPNSNKDLNSILKYVEKAFGILNEELSIKEARREAGQKYIELLCKLRNLCSNTLKNMTVVVEEES